jgi:hypothetical protein
VVKPKREPPPTADQRPLRAALPEEAVQSVQLFIEGELNHEDEKASFMSATVSVTLGI